MKLFSVLLLCVAAALGGCESVSSRVHDRFSTVPPQTQTFAAERRLVYEAAQVAVKNVGLLVGRASLAKGIVEAYAPIRSGDAIRDARQTTMQIRLSETDNRETEVSLLVSESTEGSFPGGVSGQDLKEHSLYGLYFAALQQVLLENGSLQAPAKP